MRFSSCSYYGNFIVAVEIEIPTEIPTKELKEEMKTHPLISEAKKVNAQYNLKFHTSFCASYLVSYFTLFLQWNNFFFHLLLLRIVTYAFFSHIYFDTLLY